MDNLEKNGKKLERTFIFRNKHTYLKKEILYLKKEGGGSTKQF